MRASFVLIALPVLASLAFWVGYVFFRGQGLLLETASLAAPSTLGRFGDSRAHRAWGSDPAPVRFAMLNLWLSTGVPAYFGVTLQTVCAAADAFDWWLFVVHPDAGDGARAARDNPVLNNAVAHCPNVHVRFVSHTDFVDQALRPALSQLDPAVVAELDERRVWYNEQRDWDEARGGDERGPTAVGQDADGPEQLTGWESMLRCNRLQWTRGAMWDLFGRRFLGHLNYTHWGFADPDVLHGHLAPFMSAREAWAHDVISVREIDFSVPPIHVTGHFQVFQQSTLMNGLWRSQRHCTQPLTVRELVSTPSMTDEGQFSDCMYRAAGSGHVRVLFRRVEASVMYEAKGADPACSCHRQLVLGAGVRFRSGGRAGVVRDRLGSVGPEAAPAPPFQLHVRWDPLHNATTGCLAQDTEIPFTTGLTGPTDWTLDHGTEYALRNGAFWVAPEFRWALPEPLFFDQDYDLRGCDFAIGGAGAGRIRLLCRDNELASYVSGHGQPGARRACLTFTAQLAEIRAWKLDPDWYVERWPLIDPDQFARNHFILVNQSGLYVMDIDSPTALLV